ncbi:MAG: GNAT family N-acetyltransferase [Gammaproteobacteria bacterium]|jgi:GNAT superfamily N-acetyltransferase|nr:GNAT family N-acetyltransferase [Gammaproteobacteria bacterium]MBT3860525.1 GNAT family N-acetyltransferase [Gammaproteobacteria bacterium]MBT3987349.1 GNAT family N-acetyltransferase [Gammaproteobacteria bacterium]MBT4256958.1 GNAT family N-acetyltransferase [Gammaproteobacteria bacterium]MBT4581913.1 GNAT family N-acetyltransferase [Gammaproteobacteria bacterium]
MNIATAIPEFSIRSSTAEDCELILGFIKELAEYEKLSHEVVATPETLRESLFGDKPYAEVLIAEYRDKPVGYALYFHNYSTFTGRPGIYLEDIYIQPHVRGMGFGKSLLSYLAKTAVDMNFTRVEWSVLDWNEPSIQFYRSIGAAPMDGWTVQRLDGEELASFAAEFK